MERLNFENLEFAKMKKTSLAFPFTSDKNDFETEINWSIHQTLIFNNFKLFLSLRKNVFMVLHALCDGPWFCESEGKKK